MRRRPLRLTAVALGAATLLSGACRQSDQPLPFEPLVGQPRSVTIGPGGGVLSFVPSLSLTLPPGALDRDVFFAVTAGSPSLFPGAVGKVVPGSVFEVGPAGLALAKPARLEVAVPGQAVSAADALLLTLGTLRSDGSVRIWPGGYDRVNGILWGATDLIGPVAAIVAADYLSVATSGPPSLGGGTLTAVPAPASFGAVCGSETELCGGSGAIQVWASAELVDRFGPDLALLGAHLDASLDFAAFDASGQPTSVAVRLDVGGTLRAVRGGSVAGTEVTERLVSGSGNTPVPTALVVSGNTLELQQTSRGPRDAFSYSVTPSRDRLTLRIDHVVDLGTPGAPPVTGMLTFLVELRR